MNTRGLICSFVLLSFLSVTHRAAGATNEWIKPASGSWEESYWSLGHLPAFSDGLVAIRNPGFKAVAIGANTTATYSNSLALNYFTLVGPTNSMNQLLLNYAGLNVPLSVNLDFVVGTNASLVSYYSALRGGSLYLSSPATFSVNSLVTFGSIRVGVDAATTLSLNNASLSAGLLIVGQSTNLTGTVTQNGGSGQATNLQINAGSAYHLTNGTFFATNADLNYQTGVSGVAQFTETGGDVKIGSLRMGVQTTTYPQGRGEFLLTSGYFLCASLNLITGSFQQSGGTNQIQNIAVPSIYSSFGEYYLSGGLLISSNLSVGFVGAPGALGQGNFVQSGGVHTNASMTLYGDMRHQAVTVYGSYSLNSGRLVCGTNSIFGGNFSQSGGTNYTREISLDAGGSFTFNAGELVASNTTLTTFGCTESIFIQNNGNHRIQNRLKLDDDVRYELRNGTLTATNIDIGPGAQFVLLGGSISNAGIFILRSGALRVGGLTQQLGQLQVLGVQFIPCYYLQATVPTLDVRYGGSTSNTVLHFRDSHDVPWSGTNLSIANWSASTNGAGSHHVFVGTNSQGLTVSQVSRITFTNPVGWPPGNYPARILATGELIPEVLPPLAILKKPGAVILSWTGGYPLLTATNVIGPYAPISGATSPFTNGFIDPQRFFRLGLFAP